MRGNFEVTRRWVESYRRDTDRQRRLEARERIEAALAGPYCIISAERPDKSPEVNAARTAALHADLMALTMNRPLATITPAEGRWQGAVERRFLVTGLTQGEATGLAVRFDQDAVIFDGRLLPMDLDNGDVVSLSHRSLTDAAPEGDYIRLETSAGGFYLKLS